MLQRAIAVAVEAEQEAAELEARMRTELAKHDGKTARLEQVWRARRAVEHQGNDVARRPDQIRKLSLCRILQILDSLESEAHEFVERHLATGVLEPHMRKGLQFFGEDHVNSNKFLRIFDICKAKACLDASELKCSTSAGLFELALSSPPTLLSLGCRKVFVWQCR